MNAEDREKAAVIIEAADKVLDALPEAIGEVLATLTRIEEKLDWLAGYDTDEDE
jgi:hypothetical protein